MDELRRTADFNGLHIVRETGREPPPFPSFYFIKPNTAVWDHEANVRIPKIAQDDQADYEGELVSLNPPSVV